MTIDEILESLDGEIARLREARALLAGVEVQAKRGPGREEKTALGAVMQQIDAAPKKRMMSAEGRERIAAAQRERWAKKNAIAAKAARKDKRDAKAASKLDGTEAVAKKSGKKMPAAKGRPGRKPAVPAVKTGSKKTAPEKASKKTAPRKNAAKRAVTQRGAKTAPASSTPIAPVESAS